MPVVSVVIPTLWAGTPLREAVASVCSQTLSDWEVIVVADGNDSDLSGLGDPRLRVVRQHRRGVSVARNVGVLEARSELVAFLDDDDLMAPTKLEAQVAAMAEPAVGLSHTLAHDEGNQLAVHDDSDPQYRDLLRTCMFPVTSTLVVRRRLFLEVGGFASTMRVSEDEDLILRIARESRLRQIPEDLVECRRRGPSTHPISYSGGGELIALLAQHLAWAESIRDEETVRAARVGIRRARRATARSLGWRAHASLRSGRTLEGLRLFARGARISLSRATAGFARATREIKKLGDRHKRVAGA